MQQDSCLSLNPNIHEDSSVLNIGTGYYVKLHHQVSPPYFFATQISKSTAFLTSELRTRSLASALWVPHGFMILWPIRWARCRVRCLNDGNLTLMFWRRWKNVGPFFLICFYSFSHVRHGGMKHVGIFQIHKWHCGMWWRWNVSGQEDSDGTVALLHNSKQEPWCSYWWGGKRDHVLTNMLEYFSAKHSIWWIWTSAIGNRIWFQIGESPTSSRMVTLSSLHL